MLEKIYTKGAVKLQYYEIPNDRTPLVLLHAQGVDGRSFSSVAKKLSKIFHIYSLDCYGHGGSLHDPAQYNIVDLGDAILAFLEKVIGKPFWLLGHSSGGLLAAYIAGKTDLCQRLILEDAPFFSCQGERRKSSFNYVDLSTICHNYNRLAEKPDFVSYYFRNQYAWNFFPEASRERVREKLSALAEKYRKKHPDRNLKVPFWPRAALAGFQGMNSYDPKFGEAFYDDRFHAGISHEELLKKIHCRTLFLKAKTNQNDQGLLLAALSKEDLRKVTELIADCRVLRFHCGHGIHNEQPAVFVKALCQEKKNF